MIQPNELRIGNYVTDEFYDSFKSVFEVDSINEKGINLLIEDDGNWSELAERWIGCEYTFDKLHGIPLTEQWLIDFGFRKYDTYYTRKYGRRVKYHKVTPRFSKESKNYKEPYFVYNPSRIEIKYVHQLQNLHFALTGEELTIKEKV